MFRVTRSIEWAMGHRLMRHDGRCRLPHGHNYVARVTVEAPRPQTRECAEQGMVIDFARLDAALRDVIDPLDHGYMLEEGDPLIEALAQAEPQSRITVVPKGQPPTAENIAWFVAEALWARKLAVREVQIDEGPKATATWEGNR